MKRQAPGHCCSPSPRTPWDAHTQSPTCHRPAKAFLRSSREAMVGKGWNPPRGPM
jgi:hypothetical protein